MSEDELLRLEANPYADASLNPRQRIAGAINARIRGVQAVA